MSFSERRVFACTKVYERVGISLLVLWLQISLRSLRRSCAEYAPQSEKLSSARPSFTWEAMIQEIGATFVYQGQTVCDEWQSLQDFLRISLTGGGIASRA
jgi:hypothetical protein